MKKDYISLISGTTGDYHVDVIYSGNLEFDLEHPIEATPFIETQNSKKVYWTDNLNPMRCINLANWERDSRRWNDKSFNFSLSYSTVA